MVNYYLNLNAQSNGDHEVHKESCYYYYMYKSGYNFELLGAFSNELEAVRYARIKHPTFKIEALEFLLGSNKLPFRISTGEFL